MAEFILKKMVRTAGLEEEFEIASAATSDEEIGNPVYPMARQELAKHGIGCPGKTARRVAFEDYDHYDKIIGKAIPSTTGAMSPTPGTRGNSTWHGRISMPAVRRYLRSAGECKRSAREVQGKMIIDGGFGRF